MREVIRIDNQAKSDNLIEFTHENEDNTAFGWRPTSTNPSSYDFVVYRGHEDGFDYFLAWDKGINNTVGIFRGHLNSGKY